jgi:hypothetical protein
MVVGRPDDPGFDLGFWVGAGEGNRTLMTSLEGWGSAIELRPRVRRDVGPARMRTDSVPVSPGPPVWRRGARRCPAVPDVPAAQAQHGKLRIGCRDVAQLG